MFKWKCKTSISLQQAVGPTSLGPQITMSVNLVTPKDKQSPLSTLLQVFINCRQNKTSYNDV
ncbi:hypothetical protein E2C01_015845 [Portunus trituberculatus]|uniref:Uncharacterized protein n=1 Tax=Portunus trituberculatus TaxID=210409 RepID=A0A5B7DP21_PORTR|nr:hypothetical protein [Portunus trituberculatus]